MSKIRIVQIKPEDSNRVMIFFNHIMDNTFLKTFPEEAIQKYKNDWNKDSICYACKNDGKVMLLADNEKDVLGLLFGSSVNGGVGSIIWVMVSEEQRGKGIGKDLCEMAENLFKSKGAHKVVLYTETIEAKNFYESNGYIHEGTHLNHWWNVDHYCLSKHLK